MAKHDIFMAWTSFCPSANELGMESAISHHAIQSPEMLRANDWIQNREVQPQRLTATNSQTKTDPKEVTEDCNHMQNAQLERISL